MDNLTGLCAFVGYISSTYCYMKFSHALCGKTKNDILEYTLLIKKKKKNNLFGCKDKVFIFAFPIGNERAPKLETKLREKFFENIGNSAKSQQGNRTGRCGWNTSFGSIPFTLIFALLGCSIYYKRLIILNKILKVYNMKKSIFFNAICVLVMSFCLVGCSRNDSVRAVFSDSNKYTEFDMSILAVAGENEYDDPDSLLTIEQLRTKYKYHEIFDEYMEITEDGMMVFRMSEEQWLSIGMPKSYYDNIILNFNDVNRSLSKITDSIDRSHRIESYYRGLAQYRQSWRKGYAKVKHLLN
jgi:hypothetical protein